MREDIKRRLRIFLEGSKKSRKLVKTPKYITAYDPKIKRRVVHVVRNGVAVSLVTGNKFRYSKYG